MRNPLLVLAALLPLAGLVGLAGLPSTAGAASITPEASAAIESVATNCSAVPSALPPSSFDVISAKPITGHMSIVRGCGGEEDDEGFGSREHEGGEDEDD